MTPPIFVLFELAVASLLAAATARFIMQVVGANLPTCNKEELQVTVKQTTGFALVASAFTLHSDNLLAGTVHGIYVGFAVSGIMTLVLLWEALPEILARVCLAIDASAESLAESVEEMLRGLCRPSGAVSPLTLAAVTCDSHAHLELTALTQPDFAALTQLQKVAAPLFTPLAEIARRCRHRLPEMTPTVFVRQLRRLTVRNSRQENESAEQERKV